MLGFKNFLMEGRWGRSCNKWCHCLWLFIGIVVLFEIKNCIMLVSDIFNTIK